jgi:hypothetical protein
MVESAPQLTLSPRQVKGRAKTHWDAESMTLRTDFEYAEPVVRDFPSWSDRIDRELGIKPQVYRVILGDLDVLLREGGRWESLEIRTNPAEWREATLPDIRGKGPDVWAEFQLKFDENNIASVQHASVVPTWDAKSSRLSLRLDDAQPTIGWSALADTVALGLDTQGRLSEVRVDAPDIAL